MATSSIKSTAGRRLHQNDEEENRILANPPVEWANPMAVPGNPSNRTVEPIRDVFSVSPPISAADVGFTPGQQVIITAQLAASGKPR